MKKLWKKILTTCCALIISLVLFTGCSWLQIDKYDYYNFTLKGIDYLYYNETWEASIDISLYDIVLITPPKFSNLEIAELVLL